MMYTIIKLYVYHRVARVRAPEIMANYRVEEKKNLTTKIKNRLSCTSRG